MSGIVRWGVLATGGMAASFTAELQAMPDAEVVAVASRTEASAKAFADRFGIARAYGDRASLADDEDVDVVYVATPHSAHRAAAGLCLEAGKAVLCEKAFTLNTREAEELVPLARERELFLMEAMSQSPLVPLDGSLAVMRTLDAVRDRIGVRYPSEWVTQA
jgi:predicted dehydrogenase